MEAKVLGPTAAIDHLMVREPVRVAFDSSLQEAASVMRGAGVSAVLVGNGTAIATERDLTRALAAGMSPAESIAAVVSTNPIRVPGHTPVTEAAALMLNQEIRHLVVDGADGRVSIISFREVMAVLLHMASPHVWIATLRVAVTAPPESWLG
jgi:signal-transduction protein with cAMP-binding, CBS, and nucleotidyltransferase domain